MSGGRGKWGWIAAAVVAVLAGLFGFAMTRGARYQGRSVGYWFPRMLRNNDANVELMERRRDLLTNAGPEVMPLLVEAAALRDSGLGQYYNSVLERFPERVTRVVTTYVPARFHHERTAQILRALIQRESLLRAFTNAYEQIGADVRLPALWELPLNPELREILVPLTHRMLADTNARIVLRGAVAMSNWCRTDASLMPSLVAACKAWPRDYVSTNQTAFRLAKGMGVFGTNAVVAVPWLQRWLDSGTALERVCAALSLPGIQPNRFSFVPTVMSVLPQLGAAELGLLLQGAGRGSIRTNLDWNALFVSLTPLLDPEHPVGRSLPVRVGPTPEGASTDSGELVGNEDVVRLLLRFAGSLGTNGAVAATQVGVLARHTNTVWAGAASSVLASWGPAAVAALPECVPALTNAVATPAMVLLMAACGPDAKAAVPTLREFAAGRMPEGLGGLLKPSRSTMPGAERSGWTSLKDGPPLISAELAARTGRTNEWPLPAELRGVTHLDWRSPGQFTMSMELMRRYGLVPKNAPYPAPSVPAVTLAELATEALKRIEGGAAK